MPGEIAEMHVEAYQAGLYPHEFEVVEWLPTAAQERDQ